MSLNLLIPDPIAKCLEARAAASGTTPEELALAAIKRDLAGATLDEILTPARNAFAESGLTENESLEFLESEKHAMRAERRAESK
jgi:hypothetical protein